MKRLGAFDWRISVFGARRKQNIGPFGLRRQDGKRTTMLVRLEWLRASADNKHITNEEDKEHRNHNRTADPQQSSVSTSRRTSRCETKLLIS